jgi:glucosyl-3-phosphoglycerate synthase
MVDVLEDAGLGAMAQVDLGARQNRHQPLWDLSLMSSAVLRAMASRASLPQRGSGTPGTPGVRTLRRPEVYLHAVATATGLRLDEHTNELHERPPLAQIMPAEEDQDTVA